MNMQASIKNEWQKKRISSGWISAVAGLGIWLGVITVVSAATTSNNNNITDNEIHSAIEEKFLLDSGVPSNDLNVTVNQGIITLGGEVDQLYAKKRAEKLAESLRGVRAVVNEINVDPDIDKSDAKIRRDIELALLANEATESYDVNVRVRNGQATLTGDVESWAERNLAEQVAMQVAGVTGITNRVSVDYQTNRSDLEIQTEIEERLANDIWVRDAFLDAAVDDGEVDLSGTVGSLAEKTRAQYDAWVAGVEAVNADDLTVKEWAKDKVRRRDIWPNKTDSEIRKAVADAFLYDPRVYSLNPEIMVDDGVVTLHGTVETLDGKRAAEMDALNTVGVVRVKNYLKVRPPEEVTDAELENEITRSLLRDSLVESYEINVDVNDGVATLSGTVDSALEKSQAEDVAARINGVVKVRNKIDIDFPQYSYYPLNYDYDLARYSPYNPYYNVAFKTDRDLKEDVKDQLWWSPFVDSDDIQVEVSEGVVTLSGTVDSRMEQGAAEDNALQAGALDVENNLIVVD